jgi:hypothetical protein
MPLSSIPSNSKFHLLFFRELLPATRCAILLFVSFCLTLNGGCSSSGLYSVTGKVTDQAGQPIEGLTGSEVMFIGGSTSSVGEIKADGSFTMFTNKPGDGVPPGDYTVYMPRRRIDSEREAPQSIEAKFEKPETSGLEAKVESKSNRFEFKVNRAGKKTG